MSRTRRNVGARHAKRRCPLQPGGHWPGAGSAGHGATGRRLRNGGCKPAVDVASWDGSPTGRRQFRLAPFTTARPDAHCRT